jgi:hypothetical protein
MAAYNSYQDMIDRIKNELQRNDSDIETIITNSISDAIRHFKDECFAVNQATYYTTAKKLDTTELTTNPLAGAYIDLPSDFSSMINVQVNKDGTLYDMISLPYVDLDNMDVMYSNPDTGTPEYWAYLGEYKGTGTSGTPTGPATTAVSAKDKYTQGKIRIYRRPDKDYTLVMKYVSNLSDPSESVVGGVNAVIASEIYGFWMNEGYRMIKSYAKGIIYADYLQQYEQAQAQEVMAQAEFNRLVGRSEARAFENKVVGYI